MAPYAQQNNTNAVISLVCGIAGLFTCFILSIVAIVLGRQAQSQIAASGGTQAGEGMARWGIILGWIGIALWAIGICGYIGIFVLAIGSGNR